MLELHRNLNRKFIKFFPDKIIGTLLLAQGKKGAYLGMLSASVAVNILCNMITIPLWGKMGAAMASVVSYAVAGFVFLGYYLKTYQIPLSAVFVFSPSEKEKMMSWKCAECVSENSDESMRCTCGQMRQIEEVQPKKSSQKKK